MPTTAFRGGGGASRGNSQWGDLLTKYNGKSITYTTNGNPLNDGTWKYTWRHGRQLETMTAIKRDYDKNAWLFEGIENKSEVYMLRQLIKKAVVVLLCMLVLPVILSSCINTETKCDHCHYLRQTQLRLIGCVDMQICEECYETYLQGAWGEEFSGPKDAGE